MKPVMGSASKTQVIVLHRQVSVMYTPVSTDTVITSCDNTTVNTLYPSCPCDDCENGCCDAGSNKGFRLDCGGGDGPVLEPGGWTGYCTPYYWVWFHCVPLNERWSRIFIEELTCPKHARLGSMSWECYAVNREYAGCW